MEFKKGGVALLALAVAVSLGGLAGLTQNRRADPRPPGTGFELPAGSAARLSIHVAGWVINPGVVEVPDGALVADAIEAAGGARPGALIQALNLARPVVNGDRIEVAGPGGSAGPESSPGDGRISLNSASASDLEELPGVGPVLAERIVSYRDANGPFSEPEDLLDVPGIGEAKLASIRDLVSVP